MKTILLFLVAISLLGSLQAQDSVRLEPTPFLGKVKANGPSWSVTLNGKEIFSASREDKAVNIIQLTAAQLSQKGSWVLTYTKSPAETSLKRSLTLYTVGDSVLYQLPDAMVLSIKTATLKQYLTRFQQIECYTMAIPRDPQKAALVRVRRVHLCTIELR